MYVGVRHDQRIRPQHLAAPGEHRPARGARRRSRPSQPEPGQLFEVAALHRLVEGGVGGLDLLDVGVRALTGSRLPARASSGTVRVRTPLPRRRGPPGPRRPWRAPRGPGPPRRPRARRARRRRPSRRPARGRAVARALRSASTRPRKRLREAATSSGWPRARSRSRCASRARSCSASLAKPRPGSTTIRSGAIPPATDGGHPVAQLVDDLGDHVAVDRRGCHRLD